MIANAIRNERNPYNFHHGVLAFVTGKADIELITNNLMKSLNDYNDVNKRPFTISRYVFFSIVFFHLIL